MRPFNKVLLPHPTGPIMKTKPFRAMEKLTSVIIGVSAVHANPAFCTLMRVGLGSRCFREYSFTFTRFSWLLSWERKVVMSCSVFFTPCPLALKDSSSGMNISLRDGDFRNFSILSKQATAALSVGIVLSIVFTGFDNMPTRERPVKAVAEVKFNFSWSWIRANTKNVTKGASTLMLFAGEELGPMIPSILCCTHTKKHASRQKTSE